MNERILVGVAWPYANSDLHLGQLAGAYIPPDIFARYHRLRGNDVLMVSGSDTHGTPITITAEEEGVTPEEIVERYHNSFIESLQGLGISFDLFTHTDTENHWMVTTDIFTRLLQKGFIFKEAMKSFYCPYCECYLADRYVEGTCPFCGFPEARGDQCDNCGRPLDALELIDPRCKFCGHAPEIRETEHFFLDLPQFNEPLKEWVANKDHWRSNVLNFTRNLLDQGLQPRAISRDIEWGIPVPVEGYSHKRIYVWFDAVIGYYAASIEWAKNRGTPELWHEWWDLEKDCRTYYFVGKDNIFFHTLIWPAMLMGYGDRQLPYDVPANEYLTLEGRKISSSRNWAIWAPDYLSRYDPDPLRYYLTVHAPQTSDANFSWQEFLDRNNNELVGTWGNLAHRMLTFAFRNFDQKVPAPGELREMDHDIMDRVADAFDSVGADIDACRFRSAIDEAMAAAREANRYLEEAAPWKHLKSDRKRAATVTFVALTVIDSLKVLFTPFLPFSSQRLHEYLGYDSDLFGEQYVETFQEKDREHIGLCYRYKYDGDLWTPSQLPPGQKLSRPSPLFEKLDEKIVEQELARLG
ncbi:MAG: methionine--tRNA ligase [Chloroflexota bacterium]|nr:methionine--tRNA ligase [Chloroflexota bacterium]